jgi:hypothetical protein
MHHLRYFPLCLLLWINTCANAQGTAMPPGSAVYPAFERLEIKTGLSFNSSLRYFNRGEMVQFALEAEASDQPLSDLDRYDLRRIFRDNNEWLAVQEFPTTLAGRKEGVFVKVGEDTLGGLYRLAGKSLIEACEKNDRYEYCGKPLFGIFYKTPANFFELNKSFFHFRINPVLNLKVADGNTGFQFLAQRGVELRGGIDDRIWFYTNVVDALAKFPDYVGEYVDTFKAIPGAAFYKPYESQFFNAGTAYDYLNGQAQIGFNVTRHVAVKFGHGRHFIGNGYRSVLLSDFSNNYLYLKVNWRFGKIHYQNLFAELSALSAQANPGEVLLPKKYFAAHYLGFDLTESLSIGLYEATVFSRDKNDGQFELQYLNPVILYRSVEQLLDSPDNVLIGLNLKWNFLRRFQLYGQLMMDEFKLDELIVDNQGWWANKYGVQGGLKYVDAFGIDHLDVQVEFNTVRPYTYTYMDSLSASYSHYSQPLAHPSGANFREWLGIVRWQPFEKWTLETRLIRSSFGEDFQGSNWGGNILLPYLSREQEYQNKIGQGIETSVTLLGIDLSYELWHNLYVDLHFFSRKKTSALPERSRSEKFLGGGVRMNIGQQRFDF